MADRTPEVMSNLVRILTTPDDLADLTPEEVIAAMRAGREAKKNAERWGAAELRRRGWTVEQIGEALGVHKSQPSRWLSARDEPDDIEQ